MVLRTLDAGDLEILANGDLTLAATELSIDGSSHIEVGGDIEYLAAQQTVREESYEHSTRRTLGIKTAERERRVSETSELALVTTVMSEADVLSHSGGSTTIQGTRIESASGEVTVKAGADIRIEAVSDLETSETIEKEFDLIGSAGLSPSLLERSEREQRESETRQRGAEITGETVTLEAGANVIIEGGQISGEHGATFQAGGDILVAAVFDTQQAESKARESSVGGFSTVTDGRWHGSGVSPKKEKQGEHSTEAQALASTIDGGEGTLTINAGGDVALVGSRLEAVEGIGIEAGGDVMLVGAIEFDSHSSSQSKEILLGKGIDARTDSSEATHIAYSEIDTDGQFTIKAGGTTTFGAVDIDAAATTNEAAGSAYIVQSSTQHSEHSERDADWGFQVRAGEGQSTQSGHGARIRGEITDNAATIQVQVATPADAGELEPDALRALAIEQASDPQSAWLVDFAQREDVNWQGIANVEDQWDYEHSGLTQAGTVAVVVVASVVTSGAASSAATTATASTATGAAAGAGAAAMSSQVAVNFINSGGELGAVFDTLSSDEAWKAAGAAMLTAGILNAPIVQGTTSINQWAGLTTTTNVGATVSGSGATLGQQIGGTLARAGVSAGINKVVYGGDTDSLGELFRDGLIGDLAAIGANDIGTHWGGGKNPVIQTIAHAGLGCAAAAATEGDCGAGAAGGAAESVLGNAISAVGISVDPENDWARGAYTAGAALFGGGVANELGLDVEDAQGAAQNAAVNNYLNHAEADEYDTLQETCGRGGSECSAEEQARMQELDALDRSRDQNLQQACQNPSSPACGELYTALTEARTSFDGERITPQSRASTELAWIKDQQPMYGARINSAGTYNVGAAGLTFVGDGVSGTIGLAGLGVSAIGGDAQAQEQFSQIAEGIGEFISSPIDTTVTHVTETLARADALEAAGQLDEAQRLRAGLVFEGGSVVFGGVALVPKAGQSIGRIVEQGGRQVATRDGDLPVGSVTQHSKIEPAAAEGPVVRSDELTIASNSATGEPSAIARGFGSLNPRQAEVLAQLPGSGASTIAHKSFGQRDLAALTAETGDEFAMFSVGGRRLIYRGSSEMVPITPELARQLAARGWRWSSHTHPGYDFGVLRSSPGDQLVLRAMGGRQSAIFNSMGERGVFTPNGDSLNGWKPW